MIADIDQYIENRLKKIQFNSADLPVYSYIPSQERGKTPYPCAVYLRQDMTIREVDKRPDEKLRTPSDVLATVDVPFDMGGGTLTGPESYTLKPYSTPIDIFYEIAALATSKSDNTYLLTMLLQAFPPGHQAKIGNYYPLFIHGDIIVSDQLELPLYRTSFVLQVTDIWLERMESEEVPSIQIIDHQTEII
jgi:hypothetical protein